MGQLGLKKPDLRRVQSGGGVASPWHRSTYSGRFLRAVCTTSKFPLLMQYMKVGRKSVARLQQKQREET